MHTSNVYPTPHPLLGIELWCAVSPLRSTDKLRHPVSWFMEFGPLAIKIQIFMKTLPTSSKIMWRLIFIFNIYLGWDGQGESHCVFMLASVLNTLCSMLGTSHAHHCVADWRCLSGLERPRRDITCCGYYQLALKQLFSIVEFQYNTIQQEKKLYYTAVFMKWHTFFLRS